MNPGVHGALKILLWVSNSGARSGSHLYITVDNFESAMFLKLSVVLLLCWSIYCNDDVRRRLDLDLKRLTC